MQIEIHVNKTNALKAAWQLGADAIAYGDDACAIRCDAAWSHLTPALIGQSLEACSTLNLVTPQLLTSSDEVSRFAARAADLIDLGVTGLVVNNLGLLEALRRARPAALEKVALIAGRRINTYNSRDLAVLARIGFGRATANIELNAAGIAALAPPPGMTLSMLGYGPLSLAYSRMCYVMSLKGETEYERCGIACEHESLDLGAQGQQPVFRLYGREILSARRFCAARALPRLAGRIAMLEVVLPSPSATAELRSAIDLLRSTAAGDLAPAEIGTRETTLATQTPAGLCNGALFGLPGAALASAPA